MDRLHPEPEYRQSVDHGKLLEAGAEVDVLGGCLETGVYVAARMERCSLRAALEKGHPEKVIIGRTTDMPVNAPGVNRLHAVPLWVRRHERGRRWCCHGEKTSRRVC